MIFQDDDIQVSVCIVTYNQEKYIAECLESIVTQQTNFKFEIIVGEDCSTDNTRTIVQEYVERYPELIIPLFYENNVGVVENVKQVYKKARGKYIAHLDGDDYALDNKLQTQFDALENNLDCTVCTHNMEIADLNNSIFKYSFSKPRKSINSLIDLYDTLPFFAHSSKMFVNDICDKYWDNFNEKTTDIEIHVEQAKKGNIFHLNEVFGGYRQLVGVSLKDGKVNTLLPDATKRIFDKALLDSDDQIIKKSYAKALFNYAYQSAVMGDKEGLVEYINKSVSVDIFSKKQFIFYKMSSIPSTVIKVCRLRAYLITLQ
ncbi:glycosyltransferase family 2 protein [Psychrobacter immobilis]|uniref:glycosyltransferase family 2 protein n=1 Tax=Psychrobacter immobilis TaxID=498 RepID=UPI001D0FD0E9|nr:glycosyltransferase [Psychrobacter immobilis]